MSSLLEIAKNISTVIGAITATVAFITLCVKPIRTPVINFIKSNSGATESNKKIEELSKSVELLTTRVEELSSDFKKYAESDIGSSQGIIERLDTLEEGNLMLIGNTVRSIYNQYKTSKKMPEKEFEIFQKLFSLYRDNGVVKIIYNEVVNSGEWEVVIDE